MSIVFELGISSADAVTLLPEWDYKKDNPKIESEIRAMSGRSYVYKWGDYEQFKFSCNYTPSSIAAVVNSWWDTNTELLFFITSDSVTEVNSVRIVDKSRPFEEYQRPYTTKMRGTVTLETY